MMRISCFSILVSTPTTIFLGAKCGFICSTKSRIRQFSVNRSDLSVAKCKENGDSSEEVAIWGMVEDLLRKEENRGLLAGLEQAVERVEIAKRELSKIQQQETDARLMREYVESRAAEIEECQREISEAKAMLEEAELLSTGEGQGSKGYETTDKDAERLESVKAASVSAAVGALAQLPFALARVSTTSQLILALAVAFVTCALFGVTFRYAIRRDLHNSQLKLGTAAAFGFARGLGMVEAGQPLELESSSSVLSHAFEGLLQVSECLAVFLFAGVALDFCIKLGIINSFPGNK